MSSLSMTCLFTDELPNCCFFYLIFHLLAGYTYLKSKHPLRTEEAEENEWDRGTL